MSEQREDETDLDEIIPATRITEHPLVLLVIGSSVFWILGALGGCLYGEATMNPLGVWIALAITLPTVIITVAVIWCLALRGLVGAVIFDGSNERHEAYPDG